MPRTSAKADRTSVVVTNKTVEPQEHQIGQDHHRVLKSTGPAAEALEPQIVQVVDRPVDQEKMAMMAFMNEPVTIRISPTNDPTAAQIFPVGNNGQIEIFKRGETKTVARKFVDILASRKLTTFTQIRRQNAQGIMEDVQVPSSALMYDFSVMHDPHPRGKDWLLSVLAQA
ncbi:MAG TPA: hypothetical protein VIT92_07135 [Burkholderiaceae bacterium]